MDLNDITHLSPFHLICKHLTLPLLPHLATPTSLMLTMCLVPALFSFFGHTMCGLYFLLTDDCKKVNVDLS